MNFTMIRSARLRKLLIWTLAVAMTLSGVILPPPAVRADGTTTVYAFADLVNRPGDPDWYVAATNPAGMRLTPTSFQMINMADSPEVNGEYIEVYFRVPDSGYYDVRMVSWKNIVGGTVDIYIDGEPAAEDYSFYHTSETRTTPDTVLLASGLRLSKGMHALTFVAKGTRLLASNQKYYAYLYLQQFELELKERIIELDEVTLSAARTVLAVGETEQVTLEARLSDGSPVTVTDAVYVSSSNPDVLEVAVNEQGALVTALSEGTAEVAAEVWYRGVVRRGTLTFIVGDQPAVWTYDFTEPVTSKLEDTGWEIVEYDLPLGQGSYRNQEYGIQVQAGAVGQFIAFDLLVPESGIYNVRFNGAGAANGSIAELLIDGESVGEYHFYASAYVKEKGQVRLKTLELEEGVHRFTLRVKERAGYFHMYPGQLQLVGVDRLPALEAVSLAASRTELMAGQTARLSMAAQLADGYTYDLSRIRRAQVQLTSSDESVAAVSSDGTVTAVAPGSAVIRLDVVLDGAAASDEIVITVNHRVLQSVDLAPEVLELTAGTTAELTVAGTADDGSPVELDDARIVFRSLDPAVASVDEQGIVTGLSAGTTSVEATVTLGTATATGTAQVTVVPPVLERIDLSLYRTRLFVGDRVRVKLTGTLNNGQPADFSEAEVVWSSSRPDIAGVDEDGLVTVSAPGSAVIAATVTADGTVLTESLEITAEEVTSSKTRRTYYTDEKIAAARANIARFEWAQNDMQGAVEEAEAFLALGYEGLWNLVTPQTLPRSYAVNQALGSPITGKEIDKYGNYPWLADPVNEPWKLTDPSSGYKFPTNDFGAYYRSGLDEHGIFRPELADRSLLVNTLYPEKGETWGVDDGFGWVDENGNRWTFIAYYNHWFVWHSGQVSRAIKALRDAYIYTGDMRYARAGVILLDRIADVYPDMDIGAYDPSVYLNSHGGTGKGKIIGSIWETGLVRDFISAYDAFFPAIDDPEIIGFLSAKAEQYDLGVLKTSATGIRRNIEDGIIRQIYPAVKNAQIRGNNGMHQTTLALAAVVFDTLPETKEWLDFNFQTGGLVSGPYRVTGGNINALLVNDVDRDGAGNEASPEYNGYWLTQFAEMADILDGYDLYPAADLYEHVKFRKMFSAIYPLQLSDRYFPLIGDAGNAGGPINYLNKALMIKAFEQYREPVFAQIVHFLNGHQTAGIRGDIFSEDPLAVAADIEAVIEEHGPLRLPSTNLTGYGFAALRDGVNERRFSGITLPFSELEIVEATAGYKYFENSGTIQLEAEQAGHEITFAFAVPKSDRYEINVKPFRAPSYGIYDILVDGEPVGRLDFYGSSGAASRLETIATMELDAGAHQITFSGAGKREAATNYKLGLIQLVMFDEEAQRVKNDPTKKNTQRDLWMYYGRNTGHGHKDTLNIGMHAYELNVLPELGYPEFADWSVPRRGEWESNTISHNTVVVDKSKQSDQTVAMPLRFGDGETVKLIEVEAPRVYPQTSMYRRTAALVRVDEEHSYAVDFFRVRGGNDHHYSFHSADAVVTTEGLNLVPQQGGTYAGPDVEYGQRPPGDSAPGAAYRGGGFHYLKNVERDTAPAESFSVDWQIKDTWDIYGNGAGSLTDVHLRLTMLGPIDEVALADGVPPQNKPGNPETMRFLIAHRSGDNLESTFTAVIEPYKGERYIASIEAVPVTRDGQEVPHLEARAVKVTLTNGRTDYIVSATRTDRAYLVDGHVRFRGAFGVYSVQDGQAVSAYLIDGAEIGDAMTGRTAAVTGTVVDFTRDLRVDNEIVVAFDEEPPHPERLIGAYLYAENDGERNAAYPIRSVRRLDDGTWALGTGDITYVRSWADANDFSKGFVYDLAPGAAFRIPLSYESVPPETEAIVTGTVQNGWHVGEATVELRLKRGESSVLRTEYRLNGGEWTVYEGPFPLSESGVHLLEYRSVNAAGTAETVKSATIRIDNDAPLIELLWNGESAPAVMELPDSRTVRFEPAVEDAHSGTAETAVFIDGAPYHGETLDFAGRTGAYTVLVTAVDRAGNTAEKTYTLRVTTSIDAMRELLAAYVDDGLVRGPLVNQMTNSLDQAAHHLAHGRYRQAAHHLELFLDHLNRPPMQRHIDEPAKSVLAADAETVLGELRERQ